MSMKEKYLWVLIVSLAAVAGTALAIGCALLSGPGVTPEEIYTIPPLERLYYYLDEEYDDFQMMPTYGVTEDTKVYIGYAQAGGVYIAVFQIVDGAWEWVDTIKVKKEKGGFLGENHSDDTVALRE